MRCILHGHNPVRQEGTGKYAGRWAVSCSYCGEVFEKGGDAPALTQTETMATMPVRTARWGNHKTGDRNHPPMEFKR